MSLHSGKSLVIDLGNTLSKMAIFEGDDLKEVIISYDHGQNIIPDILQKYKPDTAIISAVKDYDVQLTEYLSRRLKLIELTHTIPLPITLEYSTPETLGWDRIAGVVGANALFPGKNILIIDAGTCITYDLITQAKIYKGGSISPGISIRLKAMHSYTGRLPLLDPKKYDDLIGHSTETSMLSGVYQGIIGEAKHFIASYKKQFPDITTVITGGDHKFFESNLKNKIFAVPNLVLIGLNKILKYNV